jgi:hypothetical protein
MSAHDRRQWHWAQHAAPIEFDHQPSRYAIEVRNLSQQRNLSTELEAINLRIANQRPSFSLGIRFIMTRPSGKAGHTPSSPFSSPQQRSGGVGEARDFGATAARSVSSPRRTPPARVNSALACASSPSPEPPPSPRPWRCSGPPAARRPARSAPPRAPRPAPPPPPPGPPVHATAETQPAWPGRRRPPRPRERPR